LKMKKENLSLNLLFQFPIILSLFFETVLVTTISNTENHKVSVFLRTSA